MKKSSERHKSWRKRKAAEDPTWVEQILKYKRDWKAGKDEDSAYRKSRLERECQGAKRRYTKLKVEDPNGFTKKNSAAYHRRKANNPDLNKDTWKRMKSVPKMHTNRNDKKRVSSRTLRKKSPEKQLHSDLRRSCKEKGITIADYNELLEFQGGVCAICGKVNLASRRNRLDIDHDHSPGGVVRGLLCHKCNKGLGCFGDSLELIYEAASYILLPPSTKCRRASVDKPNSSAPSTRKPVTGTLV